MAAGRRMHVLHAHKDSSPFDSHQDTLLVGPWEFRLDASREEDCCFSVATFFNSITNTPWIGPTELDSINGRLSITSFFILWSGTAVRLIAALHHILVNDPMTELIPAKCLMARDSRSEPSNTQCKWVHNRKSNVCNPCRLHWCSCALYSVKPLAVSTKTNVTVLWRCCIAWKVAWLVVQQFKHDYTT